LLAKEVGVNAGSKAKIDCCITGYMIYNYQDKKLVECKFCQKSKYFLHKVWDGQNVPCVKSINALFIAEISKNNEMEI